MFVPKLRQFDVLRKLYIQETGYGDSFHLGEIVSVLQVKLYMALMEAQDGLPVRRQGKDVLICLHNIVMIMSLMSPATKIV